MNCIFRTVTIAALAVACMADAPGARAQQNGASHSVDAKRKDWKE